MNNNEKVYNKLIRDNLKEKILSDCKSADFSYVKGEDKKKALQAKLIEEANEFAESSHISELADIFEVLDTILEDFEIDIEEVRKVQKEKRERRGGFKTGLFLEKIEFLPKQKEN